MEASQPESDASFGENSADQNAHEWFLIDAERAACPDRNSIEYVSTGMPLDGRLNPEAWAQITKLGGQIPGDSSHKTALNEG
jgi:hypothetical protein